MPLVSVVIPTYNRAHLLQRSVKSVLSQTFKDFELLIVDDNSNDDTISVVNGFQDVRIKYLKHDKNMGPSAARNTGMKNAVGKYIAFQDSDDEWLKEKLAVMVERIENTTSDYGLIFSSLIVKKENGDQIKLPVQRVDINDGNILGTLLINNVIDTPSAMIKKECLADVGEFDTSFKCYEDYDYFIRVAKKYKVIYIEKPLYFSYETAGGVNSAKYSVQAEMHRKILNKHIDLYSKDITASAERNFRIGDFFCLDENYSEGIIYIKAAINLNAGNPDYILRYLVAQASRLTGVDFYKMLRKPMGFLKNKINTLNVENR